MLGSRALQNATWHWLTVQCVSPASFYHFSPCSTYRSPSFSLLHLSSSWISFEPFSLSCVVDNCVFVFNWLHTLLTDSQSQHKHTHSHIYIYNRTHSLNPLARITNTRRIRNTYNFSIRKENLFRKTLKSPLQLAIVLFWLAATRFVFKWGGLPTHTHTHTCLSSSQTIKGHLEAIIILDRFLFPWKIEESLSRTNFAKIS